MVDCSRAWRVLAQLQLIVQSYDYIEIAVRGIPKVFNSSRTSPKSCYPAVTAAAWMSVEIPSISSGFKGAVASVFASGQQSLWRSGTVLRSPCVECFSRFRALQNAKPCDSYWHSDVH